jgi:hypothetical protein
MARIKTLLTTVAIDLAKKSHNCQANAAHRVQMGDRRLGVKKERSWDYYCIDCGTKILERDAEKIKATLTLIARGDLTVPKVGRVD